LKGRRAVPVEHPLEVTPALTPEAYTLDTVCVPMDPEPLILPVRESEIEKV
jgi:hypothetical protein